MFAKLRRALAARPRDPPRDPRARASTPSSCSPSCSSSRPRASRRSSSTDGTVEYAVYGAPGELPALPDLRRAAPAARWSRSRRSEIADDWHERWKELPPAGADRGAARRRGGPRVRRAAALRVRPPWEPPSRPARPVRREIVIDPGQAFGTGAHATHAPVPRAAARAGRRRAPRAAPLLDVGTGSGVLAIAAAQLGFAPRARRSTTSPRASRAAARERARQRRRARGRRFDLRARAAAVAAARGRRRPATVLVLANLLRPLLLELAARACRARPPHLIAGGLLREEVDEVVGGLRGARSGCASARARQRAASGPRVWLSRVGRDSGRRRRARSRRARSSGRRRSIAGRTPSSVSQQRRAPPRSAAPIVSSASPSSPGSGSRQAAIAISSIAVRLLGRAREQRRADEARVAVDAREPARERDRRAAPRRR